MFAKGESLDATQRGRPAPAAILDVDGPLYEADVPLGVGFTAYLFEETAGEVLEADIDVQIGDQAYFEEDEWDTIAASLDEYAADRRDVFDAGRLAEMNGELVKYLQGEQNYPTSARAIVNHWVNGVEGMSQADVEEHAEAYVDDIEPDIPRPVNNVIGQLRGRGYDVYLVSLNPKEVLKPFAEVVYGGEFGRNNVYGTVVATDEGGRYLDHLERNMLQEEGKGAAIEDIRQRSALNGRSLAIGDTAEDMPLFEAVGNAAVVNPVPGFGAEDVREQLGSGERPARREVFNIFDVSTLMQRLFGTETESQVRETESIEEFLSLLESDMEGGVRGS